MTPNHDRGQSEARQLAQESDLEPANWPLIVGVVGCLVLGGLAFVGLRCIVAHWGLL